MRHETLTGFKRWASRILDRKEPVAILRHGKIAGYYVPAESLAFDTLDDAAARELTRSILDQRSDALAYLAKR